MFYNALIKFRDEQLENYEGQPLEYSASDYHHISRPAARAAAKRAQNSRGHGSLSRRRSQFSVIAEASPFNPPKEAKDTPKSTRTVESYDPYRPSKNPIVNPEVEYTNVTVHRKNTGFFNNEEIAKTADNTHSPADKTPEPEEADIPNSCSFEILRANKPKMARRSFYSRSSIASSRRGHNCHASGRSVSYKRNVSFHHLRNRSQGGMSAKGKAAQMQAKDILEQHMPKLPQEDTALEPGSSPSLPSLRTMVRGSGIGKQGFNLKTRDHSVYWREEARKVSNELGQICEEAFNGSSVSTRHTASSSQYMFGSESPPTSVSLLTPENSHQWNVNSKSGHPSTERSFEQGDSRTIDELTETRRRLIAHSNAEGSEGLPEYLADVIFHLDRLIEEDKAKEERIKRTDKTDENDQYRRAISDPIPKPVVDVAYLPSISEELLSQIENNPDLDLKLPDQRSISEYSRSPGAKTIREKRATIRMVPHDSFGTLEEIKPLTIRKNNHSQRFQTVPLRSSADSYIQLLSPESPTFDEDPIQFSASNPNQRFYLGLLDPINENPQSPQHSDSKSSNDGKRWPWFNKAKLDSQGEQPTSLPTEPKRVRPSEATVIVHELPLTPEESHDETQKTLKKKQSFDKGKGGFLKMFSKKKQDKPSHEIITGE